MIPSENFQYFQEGPESPYFDDMLECCGFQKQGRRIRHLSGELDWPLEEFDLYKANMALLQEGIVTHLYELVNLFFLPRAQYDIISHRYLRRQGGEVVETPWEMAERVADFVSDAETLEFRKSRRETKARKQKWFRTYFQFLLQLKFLPNSPTLASGGVPGYGSFACAVLKTGDSLNEISRWYDDALFGCKYGFGLGHSLHPIRPKGAPFGNSNHLTRGSLHWLDVIQAISVGMAQGNQGRSGANMATIPVWHPDVEEFIPYKTMARGSELPARDLMKAINMVPSEYLSPSMKQVVISVIDQAIPCKNFNFSVLMNNTFMEAVQNDAPWTLNFSLPDKQWKVQKEVPAKELFERIVHNAWENGDPGVQFYDAMNSHNWCPSVYGKYYTSNPCCVTGDTWVMTPYGPKTVEELLVFQDAEGVPCDKVLVNGLPYRLNRTWDVGSRPVVRIETVEGFTIRVTPEHRMFLYDETTSFPGVEICAGELEEGHQLALANHFLGEPQRLEQDPWFTKANPVDEYKGYLLGMLIGDGTFVNCDKSDWGQPRLDVWEKDIGHQGLLDAVLEAARALPSPSKQVTNANQAPEWVYSKDNQKWSLHYTPIRDLAHQYGVVAGNKTITPVMERASGLFAIGLIRGLFDADGSVQGNLIKGVSIRLGSVNKPMLQAVQRILARLGIYSRIYDRKDAGVRLLPDGNGGLGEYECQANYELVISCADVEKYRQLIGFNHSRKLHRLEAIALGRKRQPNRTQWKATVSAVVAEEETLVYDLNVDTCSRFDGNGFLTHNSEIILPPYGVCVLGTVNVLKHYSFQRNRLRFAEFRDTVHVVMRFLDGLISMNDYPPEIPEMEEMAKGDRRIGIDICGLADTLYMLGISYGSKESYQFLSRLSKTLYVAGRDYSVKLGSQKGSAPFLRKSTLHWDEERDLEETKKCPFCGKKNIRRDNQHEWCEDCIWFRAKSLRNLYWTTQAPTGTRARVAGVSFGLEPHHFPIYVSRIMEGQIQVNMPVVLEWPLRQFCAENGYDFEMACQCVAEYEESGAHDGSDEASSIVEMWKDLVGTGTAWQDAHGLTPMQHLQVQAACQEWNTQGVSKTINLPGDATEEQVRDVYRTAWEMGLKGVTIYREGSHWAEVIGKLKTCPDCGAQSTELLFVEGCFTCLKCGATGCEV